MSDQSDKNLLYQRTRRVADRCVRCYLTLACDSQCSFCSAQVPAATAERRAVALDPEIWAEGLNRRGRHTILAGGEPFLYHGFIDLIRRLDPGYKVEIYTNLRTDPIGLVKAANRKFQFLISLHPGTPLWTWRNHVEQLAAAGHGLRFHIVRSQGYERLVAFLKESGIVGRFKTSLQGDQRSGPKSAGAEVNQAHPQVRCTSRIYLFGPDGFRYHCVHKLVGGESSGRFEHISLPDEGIETRIYCEQFGLCAGCDNNIEGQVESVRTAQNGTADEPA
jgi:hypothetical protein